MYSDFGSRILVISRPKLNGLGEHWGVQLINGTVAHGTSCGIRVESIEGFSSGKDIKIIREVPAHLHSQIMQRLHTAQLQKLPYDLTKWNCEIFANWLVGEKPESPQVKGWVGIMGLVAGTMLLSAMS